MKKAILNTLWGLAAAGALSGCGPDDPRRAADMEQSGQMISCLGERHVVGAFSTVVDNGKLSHADRRRTKTQSDDLGTQYLYSQGNWVVERVKHDNTREVLTSLTTEQQAHFDALQDCWAQVSAGAYRFSGRQGVSSAVKSKGHGPR